MNLNLMVCLFQELKMAKFTKELLEVSLETLVKEARHIDAVLWLIELDTLCFIHFSEER